LKRASRTRSASTRGSLGTFAANNSAALRRASVVWCDGWTDCFDWFDFPPRPHDDYGFNNHVLRLLETKLVEREAAARDPYALLSLGVREVVRDTAIARALARRFSPPPETTGPSPLLASEAAGPESPEAALARAEAYVAMRDRFVRHVSTMRDLCVARNVRFIAVFQPEISCRARPTETEIRILNEKPGYARSFVPIWRKFKKETTEAFARAGLSVDDASNFPELRDAVPACFLDVVHLSAEGADRVAAALAARLD
jgi:lysophospholipase L1-like esterase